MTIEQPKPDYGEKDNVLNEEAPLASDEFELQPSTDPNVLLEKLDNPRDPYAEVKISEEAQSIGENLEAVNELIAKEKERETALGDVRAQLHTPHESGETLKKLEAAKEKLEEEKHYIQVAEKYENVFEEFSGLSEHDREEVARTGKNKEGKSFQDTYGNEVETDTARKLARSFIDGGGRLTWGGLSKLGKIVDEILKRAKEVIKGIFGGGEEQAHAE